MDINHQHHLKLTTSTWAPTIPNMDDHIFHNQQQQHQLQQQQEDACFNHHHHIWPSFPLQNPHHSHHVIPSSSNQLQQQVLPFDHVVNNHVQTLLADHDQERDEDEQEEEAEEELGAMKEMMFKIAAMQPVDIDPATIRKPKRRNVRISNDPQSVAARLRRERISEKIRILQRLVPGGTKMDTASMLDEAIRYVKFLKRQIRQLQSANHPLPPPQVPVPPCPSTENWANNNIVTPAKALVLGSSSTMVTPNASDPMYEVIGN